MESLMQSCCSPVIIPLEACIHIEVCIHHFMQSPSKSSVWSKQLKKRNQLKKNHQNPVPVEFFLMLMFVSMLKSLSRELKLDKPLYAKSIKKRHLVKTAAESESARQEPSESSTSGSFPHVEARRHLDVG